MRDPEPAPVTREELKELAGASAAHLWELLLAMERRAVAAESALAAERARADLATAQRDTFAALHETEWARAEKAEAALAEAARPLP